MELKFYKGATFFLRTSVFSRLAEIFVEKSCVHHGKGLELGILREAHNQIRATPLSIAACATAFATASPTRLSNAFGMM